MAVIDLRPLVGETVVVYFGGSAGSIDALTFGNALIAFVDAARAVNEVVYPGDEIEIRLEAQADGSFKAQLRRVRKGLPGFLGRGAENLFWTFVGAAIMYAVVGDQRPRIELRTDEVIIETGKDRLIVPREVHDKMPNVQRSPEVRANLNHTFRIIQKDQAVKSFGMLHRLESRADENSPLMIPREDFSMVIEKSAVPLEQTEKIRLRQVEARLIILKAWVNGANRKWMFEWNGVPISAPIKDELFLQRVRNHEQLFGSRDALDVELTFKQNFVDSLGVYENDPNSFVIKRVIKPVPRALQARL
jgi:hypothetical protein